MRIHFSPRFVTLPGFAGRSRRHFSNFVLDPALGQRAVKGKIIIGQDLQGRRPAFCRECVCVVNKIKQQSRVGRRQRLLAPILLHLPVHPEPARLPPGEGDAACGLARAGSFVVTVNEHKSEVFGLFGLVFLMKLEHFDHF